MNLGIEEREVVSNLCDQGRVRCTCECEYELTSTTADWESYDSYNLQGINEVHWKPPLQQEDWINLVSAIHTALELEDRQS